jgi:hypothetical protein
MPKPPAPYLAPEHTTAQKWGTILHFYIKCLGDHAEPLAAQRPMHQQWQWDQVLTMQADHLPCFSMPEQLIAPLVSLANSRKKMAP